MCLNYFECSWVTLLRVCPFHPKFRLVCCLKLGVTEHQDAESRITVALNAKVVYQ